MKRTILVLAALTVMLLSACQARQNAPPITTAAATDTPVATQTTAPLPSATATVPATLTAAATSTAIPTIIPTPLPGLGIETSAAATELGDFFTFNPAGEVDGQPAQKGVSESGFSTVTLVGDPYLTQAELVVDLSKEGEPALTAYWIAFLQYTADVDPANGQAAAEWVRDHFRDAVKNGQAEQTFGNKKVTMRVSGANSQILAIKVEQ